MSLILEALKKSEQQRRLGEAPTLASPVVATRRRRSVLPVLAVLIVLAAAAGWWLMRPAPAPPAAPPADAGTAATKPAEPTARATPKVDPAEARMKKREANLAALADADAKRRGAANPQNPGASAKPPAAGSGPPDLSKPAARAPLATATQTPGMAPVKPEATPAPDAAKPGEKPAVATAPPPTETATAKPAASGAPVLPSIWELPYSTRKDLPAIELSMHVYSSDPAQRFVVVKGDRHVEGDELGQDLYLREIRQDGLVLEFKGQRFVYPRGGR